MTSAPGPPQAPPPVTRGQLLCAFAYASDLAFGLQLEDSLRSCYVAVRMAAALGLSAEQREAAYYTALLKDAGCTSWTTELAQALQTDEIVARRELMIFGNHNDLRTLTSWMRQFVAPDRSLATKLARYVGVLTTTHTLLTQGFATATVIAERIAGRLAMPNGSSMGCSASLSSGTAAARPTACVANRSRGSPAWCRSTASAAERPPCSWSVRCVGKRLTRPPRTPFSG